MKNKKTDPTRELSRAIARIQANILALIFALVGGLGLFLMTAWLLIKGGENVGEHLQLLGQYFIGYTITWRGSLVGGIAGWLIGWIYNLVVGIRYK